MVHGRGPARRGAGDRGGDRVGGRKRRAGGFSGRWSDDDDVVDELPPWQGMQVTMNIVWKTANNVCIAAAMSSFPPDSTCPWKIALAALASSYIPELGSVRLIHTTCVPACRDQQVARWLDYVVFRMGGFNGIERLVQERNWGTQGTQISGTPGGNRGNAPGDKPWEVALGGGGPIGANGKDGNGNPEITPLEV